MELSEKSQARIQQLISIGMWFDFNQVCYVGKHDHNKDFNVSAIEITTDTDEEWDKKIKNLSIELQVRKPKKALLVEFNIRTRIIIDEDQEDDDDFIIATARDKIQPDLSDYLCGDNVEIDDDEEMPFDPLTDYK
jgi:hypothetical protein